MKREIKFRAWDSMNEKMITSYDDLESGWFESESMPLIPLTGSVVRPYWEKRKFDAQPHLEVMQYTGRKDKEGTGIYEGDIVEENGIVGVVVWMNKFCSYRIVTTQGGEIGLYPFYGKVIGNKYQNPELLEADQ